MTVQKRTTPAPGSARIHVTPMMLADIWQDDDGPRRVAAILAGLSWEEREQLAQGYWNLLRQRGHPVSLVEIGIQFCVIELAA